MSNVQFAKETILIVLSKMEQARQRENNKEYRTLSDSLRETVDIVRRQPMTNYIDPFMVLLEEEIKEEVKSLTEVANKTIEDNKFKEHHDWLIAFRKLDSIVEFLSYHRRRVEKYENLPQFKNEHSVYNLNGTHVIVSTTMEHAIMKLLANYMLEEDSIKLTTSGDFKYQRNQQTIIPRGVENTNIMRGVKGEVLHIDKAIGLKKYVEKVEQFTENFDVLNVI